jgi:(2Fe-2S) ferredoxin
MAKQKESPFACHIFVCTNDRKGINKSCADYNSSAIRKKLKEEVEHRGWKGRIRVSKSGCMGLCASAPNILIYPQKIWLPEASTEDTGMIMDTVETIL